MKKELVLVKDINNFWSCALCVTCTEGKQITDSKEAIDLIKQEYADLTDAKFVVENSEIYAFIDELQQVNHGNRCK
jgi:hypothetical protein